MVDASQIRAARAMLSWTQEELARRSGTSRRLVIAVEKGVVVVGAEITAAIVEALQKAGIQFVVDRRRRGVFQPASAKMEK